MEIIIPEKVQNIINQINLSGGKAYLVGGALRDLLRGVAPKDYDIASTLSPTAILLLFPNSRLVGKECGTVEYNKCEITPLRREADYCDGRHPKNVEFCEDIIQDLARRDFTMNALAYDGTNLIDPYNGSDDIRLGIIRAVGDATKRFSEDYLRILRLFRFAAITGFTCDIDTFDAAIKCAPNIAALSRERVKAELQQILLSQHPMTIAPLISSGGLSLYGFNTCTNCLHCLTNVPPIMPARLWALCQLCGADIRFVCSSLGFSAAFLKKTHEYSRIFYSAVPNNKIELKQMLYTSGNSDIKAILMTLSALNSKFVQVYNVFCEICQTNEPFLLKHLAISGGDILLLGAKSTQIGKIMTELLQLVIKEPLLNNYEILIKLAKSTKNYL